MTFPDGRSTSGRVSGSQITAINASAPSVVWAAGGVTGHDVITGNDGSTQEVIPALATLAVVSTVCSSVVAYEATRHRAARIRIRRAEGAG